MARAGGGLAIVLHGKVGGMESLITPGGTTRAVDGARASAPMMALCYASLLQHIVQPNQRRGMHVDIFGHSWSPEVGAELDALYRPLRSAHEPVVGNLACPSPLFRQGRGQRGGLNKNECLRTVSHLLGIRRAIELKMAEEKARGGAAYAAVFLSRWDVLWNRPMALPSLPGWEHRGRNRFWLPHHCTQRSTTPRLSGNTPLKKAVCGGVGRGWRAPQAAIECRQDARPCQTGYDMSFESREVFLLDWWLVTSSSAAADTFGVGMHLNVSLLSNLTLSRLTRLRNNGSRATPMGHGYWGLQLLHVMNATLLWTRHTNIDFTLGRAWGDVDCFALRPRCATRARCTAADLLRRPWQPQGLEQRDGASEWPPPATYAGPRGAHPMRSSCSDSWFQCAGSYSRMCHEADAAAAPLDRAAPRALFVACAERACEERSRLKAGGARCAGLLLHTLVRVMSDAPEANRSLGHALPLSPHHEQARAPPSALPALQAQAASLLNPGGGAAGPWPQQPLCQHAVRMSGGGRLRLQPKWKSAKAL